MGNTNASPTLFGFDFQVNAAIVLMLDNIKKLEKLRLEGATEDIELTLDGGKKLFAQAKAVVKASSDFSHVRANLKKAVKTLSAVDGKNVKQLILITNSVNPLNEDSSRGAFYGPPTDVGYGDLPPGGQKVIDDIINRLGVTLDTDKFRIKFFRFETDSEKERYKAVLQSVTDFVNRVDIGGKLSSSELMEIWQNSIFRNGTKMDVTVRLSKTEIVWPMMVLCLNKQNPAEYLEDYDSGLADEIQNKYSQLINNCVERYEVVTQILYDFNKCKVCPAEYSRKKRAVWFVEQYWKKYVGVLTLNSLDEELQEGISKLVLSKIIQQRYVIDSIKKETLL